MPAAAVDRRPKPESMGLRMVLAQLALGALLAVRGGRGRWARLLMGAVGLGLCVLVLLAGTSVTTAMAARQARAAAVEPVTGSALMTGSAVAPPTTTGLFEIHRKDLVYGEKQLTGTYLAPLGGSPALPPGLSHWPADGDLVVSPALAELLGSPVGDSLRQQMPGRVAGVIGAEGLTSSNDLRFYAGIAPTVDGPTGVRTQNDAVGWRWGAGGAGVGPTAPAISPYLQALITAGAALVLVPLTLFVMMLSRMGAAATARRLGAIRLIGGSGAQIRLLAAGETLVSAVLGVGLGGGAFLSTRQLAGSLVIGGEGFFPSDFRPAGAALLLVLIGTPVVAVTAAVVGATRAVRDPLLAIGPAPAMRPRPSRQRVVGTIAVVLIVGCAVVTELSSILGPSLAVLGVCLTVVLVAVPVFAPLLLRGVLRTVGSGGSIAWQLGVRRLQDDTTLPARLVAGASVVVAGAIALQSLVVGLSAQLAGASHSANHEGSFLVQVSAPSVADLTGIPDRIRSVGGYSDFRGGTYLFLTTGGLTTGGSENSVEAYVGTCDQILDNIGIDRCSDGDAFAISDGWASGGGSSTSTAGLRPGSRLRPQPADSKVSVTLPANFRAAAIDPDRVLGTDFAPNIVLTPRALGQQADEVLRTGFSYLLVRPTSDDNDTLLSLRDALGSYSWRSTVSAFSEVLPSSGRLQLATTVRWGLIAAGLLTLVVTGAGLVLVVVQQLLDRRRALTLLVASGVPRAVVGRAVMIGALIPAVVGTVLATVVGAALAAGLQLVVVGQVNLQFGTIAVYAGIGLLGQLAATAATLPALRTLTRLESLRTG